MRKKLIDKRVYDSRYNIGKRDMREPGFEPGLTARKAVVLPLDYSRFSMLNST